MENSWRGMSLLNPLALIKAHASREPLPRRLKRVKLGNFASLIDKEYIFFSSIRYHGSSSSIKCHVYHHFERRRHLPVVCNERREPHTSHYPNVNIESTRIPRVVLQGLALTQCNEYRSQYCSLWSCCKEIR